MRSEQQVFDELSELCTSPGYVHALASISFNNLITYLGEMTVEDIRKVSSKDRLLRTEISTLIGLLIKADIVYSLPKPDVLKKYIKRTYALLEELHQSMLDTIISRLNPERTSVKETDLRNHGEAMREPIFYGPEGAYSFQYRDLSVKKYSNDNDWLQLNKGFSIQNARDVVHAITKLQDERFSIVKYALRFLQPAERTLLPGFSFNARDVADFSGIEQSTVDKVLAAFTIRQEERNEGFRTLHDFNVANAAPLVRGNDNTFILFQQYSLAEALYESPFYWMGPDRTYVSTAMQHRGRFTEDFAKERLELVFGKTRVFANVDIYESKSKKAGEIDVLVIFGNRAIVLQGKSKRLTLEARKGNDGQIKQDFKKSIQDAYDQGYECAKLLNNSKYTLIDGTGRIVSVQHALKEVYIFCVVADHYPALSFQVRNFLRVQTAGNVQPPLVMDVFTLDAIAEMLQSPLQFLSYINRRTAYSDKLLAGHESIILSYHLKRNLWVDEKYGYVSFEDDFSADLDLAMSVRREGFQESERQTEY